MPKKISDRELKRLLYPDGRAKDIYRRASYPLVKIILPLGVHPDAIHIFRLLSCLAGTALFFTGDFVLVLAGALLFQWNILLDTFDGALARHQGKASVKGEYQDVALDHLASSILYFASAAGFGYALTGATVYLWVGLFTVLLAQVAAFLRAMYTEYGIPLAARSGRLVRLAHQDNSRLFAFVLLLAAVFMLPAAAAGFFLVVVVAKIMILSVHIVAESGRNPLSPAVFARYVLLIIVLVLFLAQKILRIDTRKARRWLVRSKSRSVIEKQVTRRLD